MSLAHILNQPLSRGYTAFGCLEFLADVRGLTREPVLTGVVSCPHPITLAGLAAPSCKVALFQSPVSDPFAAFAEDAGDVRFYFLVNLLDPECRALLERATEHGGFQMVLAPAAGNQRRGFWMEQPFQESLELTVGQPPRPFDQWVNTCMQLAPGLPKLFSAQHGDRPMPSTHCAVIMLPPSRWADVDTLVGSSNG